MRDTPATSPPPKARPANHMPRSFIARRTSMKACRPTVRRCCTPPVLHTAAAALPHARRWQTRTAAARPLARRGHVRRCHARAGLHRRLRGFARRSQLRSVTRTRRSLRPRLRRRAHGGRLVSSARPPTQRESRCYCVPCNHPLVASTSPPPQVVTGSTRCEVTPCR